MTPNPCDYTGVLTRDLQVRVVDISGAGCLIESQRRLEPGTIGRLRLTFGDDEYAEHVEVVRCQRLDGRCVYHVGVRFIWMSPCRAGSIREALARRVPQLEASPTVRVM